ncbi:BadF/BadG/BcrA/BcrD ATPase family protein [Tepidibacillus sp. HK-1]|nr:BadF/BadG/BcrA/BcrD ATPase family protein [Tepidibacillus sp. HK-1]GBF10479.1 badF/BadG/BcrA/BcrD ATPase family protein [Tepidibacillus sp. HK-1]
MVKAYLGIDVGSVSTNVVAIDESNQVLFHKYLRTNGQSIDSIKKGLESLKQKLDAKYVISGVGTTGSGRQIAGVMVGADVVKNEISAHAVAAIQLVPNV